ncbi:Ig-like domain-containing protein, partial [Vibrio neonatus]
NVHAGAWSVTIPTSALAQLTDAQAVDITADVTDAAGNPAAQATHSLLVDTNANAPSIHFEDPGSDGIYNALEVAKGNANTITATIQPDSDAKVGDVLHYTIKGNSPVEHTLTQNDLTDGVTVEVHPGDDVTATVTDVAGNVSSSTSETAPTADTDAGSISITPNVSIDNIINHADLSSELKISGSTSGIEVGQVVDVEFNNHHYTADVKADHSWTLNVPIDDLALLHDGNVQTITANVSDHAGNPATPATHNVDVDIFAGAPSINFSDSGADGIYNAAELNPDGTATATIDLPKDATVGDTLKLSIVLGSQATVDGHYALTAQDISAGHVDFEVQPGSKVRASITDNVGNTSNEATATAATADITLPSAAIHVEALTVDNTINSFESRQDVSVVGHVTGDFKQGDTVTVTIDKQTYTGTLEDKGNFNVKVPGSVLKDHTSFEARIDTTDLAGNKAHATTTHDYSVDTQTGKPSISLESAGSDHTYNIQEVGSDGTVTATIDIPHDAVVGDVLTINNAHRMLTATDISTRQVMTEVKPGSTVTASITDKVGNVSELATVQVASENLETPKVTINVDSITSDNIINQIEAGSLADINAGTSTQLITGTVQGDFNSGDIVVIDNIPSATGIVDSSGKFSIPVPTKELLGQTSLHLHMDTQNAAGNPGHGTAVHDYSVDTQVGSPIITFEGQQGNPHIYNANEVGPDGTIKATIMLSPDTTIQDTLTVNGKPVPLTQDIVKSGEVVIEVQPGERVEASITDNAGNVSATAHEIAPIVDLTPATPIVALKNDTGFDGDRLTNDGTLDVTGIEVGATVEYSVDGTHWTNSFTATEKLNNVYVRQTDATGNVSKSNYFQFVLDTKVDEPTIHFQKPSASNIYNKNDVDSDGKVAATIDLPHSATSGDILTFDSSDHVLSIADIQAKCITTRVKPGTALSATYTDQAGNVSNVVTETAPDADIKPPSVHIHVDSVATDDIINNSESQQVTVPITGEVTGEFNSGDTVTVSFAKNSYSGAVDSSGHFSIDVPSNDLIGHTSLEAKIATTDAAGNTGSDTDTHTYTVATDIPIVTLGSIAFGNDPRPAISGHVDVKSSVLIPVGTEVEIQIVGDSHTYKVTTDAHGDFVLAKGALQQDLPDGQTDIIATVTDVAGNVGKTSEQVDVDTTAPTPQIYVDDITTDNYINSSESKGDVLVTGKVTGSSHSGAAVTLTVHGKEFHGTTDAQGIYKIKVSGADLKDDTSIEAKVVATDKAGNQGSNTTIHSYFVDTTLRTPVISLDPASDTYGQDPASSAIHIGSDSDNITKDVTPTFSITGVDVDAKSVEIFDGKTSLGFAQRDGKGLEHWSFTPPKGVELTKGIHHITAAVTDKAGNHASSIVCDVTIYTENPKPTLSVHNANNDNASPILTGTAEAGSIVVIKDGKGEIGSVLADKNGNYEYDMSSKAHAHTLGEGTHELVAEAIDEAGNAHDSDSVSTTIKPEPKLVYAGPGENTNAQGGTHLIYGTLDTHQTSAPVDHDIHLTIDKHEVTIKQDGTIVAPGLTIDDAHQFLIDHPNSGNVNGGDNHIVSFTGVDDILAHTSNTNLQKGVQSVNGDGYYLYLPGKSSDYTLNSEITGSGSKYNISGGLHGHGIDITSMNGVRGIIFSNGETLLASSEQKLSQGSLSQSVTTETFHMNTDTFLHTTSDVADSHRVVVLTGNEEESNHCSTEFKIIAGDGTVIATNENLDQGDNIVIHENQLKGLHIEIPKGGKINLHFEGHIEQNGQQIGDTLGWHFVVAKDGHVGRIEEFEYHSSSSSSSDEPAQDIPEIDLNALADSSSDHHSAGASAYLEQLGIDAQHHAQAHDQPSDIDVVLGHDPATSVDDHGVPVVDHSIQPDHTQHQDDDDPTKHHHHTDTVDWGSSHH